MDNLIAGIWPSPDEKEQSTVSYPAPDVLMGKSGSLPGWQLCRGISGSFRVEWVAGFVWNQWQPWSGIRTLHLDCVDVVGHDTGGAVALILAIEHQPRVNRLVITNSVCYDRFDDDMLDFGHPLRWKDRPIADLMEALDESLAAGLSNRSRLTPEFRSGITAPWASEEGKLSLLRNASALNANQTMALVDRHGSISAPTMILWGMDDPWQKSADGIQLSKEIPGALFKPLNGVAHWVQQDAPKEFTAALLEFLANAPNRVAKNI